MMPERCTEGGSDADLCFTNHCRSRPDHFVLGEFDNSFEKKKRSNEGDRGGENQECEVGVGGSCRK